MLHDKPDLAELIAAIAKADRQAFGEVYTRTAAKLLGVILRILKDRGQAEDVLQEVYLRVWQAADRYSPETGRPMTWLITIARNRAIDVVRQRRETTAPATDVGGPDWFDLLPDPRNAEAELTDIQRLRHCLGELDEKQRSCLLAAYYEGFSREELAMRYSAPVNTVKTWLHRSAATLRNCLGAP